MILCELFSTKLIQLVSLSVLNTGVQMDAKIKVTNPFFLHFTDFIFYLPL